MAIQAVNLNSFKEVTLPEDKDDPTRFSIGAIDSRVLGILTDNSTKVTLSADAQTNPDAETGVQVNQHALMFKTVQFGLKGFVNFKNGDDDVEFTTERIVIGGKGYDCVKSDIVAMLPRRVLNFLSEEISELNSVTEKEGK